MDDEGSGVEAAEEGLEIRAAIMDFSELELGSMSCLRMTRDGDADEVGEGEVATGDEGERDRLSGVDTPLSWRRGRGRLRR